MTEARPSYPRPQDTAGLAAALALALSWFVAADAPVGEEGGAVAVLRQVASGAAGADALLAAGRSLPARTHRSAAFRHAYVALHTALAVAVNATLGERVTREVYRGWEEQFYAHLVSAATALGSVNDAVVMRVTGADHQLRVAASTAAASIGTSTTATKARPKGLPFDRCLGMVMEHLREKSSRTREELAAAVTAGGRSLSAETLRRIESGATSNHAAAPHAVQALGRSWDWALLCTDKALRLGGQFATLSCGVEGDDWFEGVAGKLGDKVATSILRVAVVSTVHREGQ